MPGPCRKFLTGWPCWPRKVRCMKKLFINSEQRIHDEREIYSWYNLDFTQLWKGWGQKGRIPFTPDDVLSGKEIDIDIFGSHDAHMRIIIRYGEEENGTEEDPEGQEQTKEGAGADPPSTH